MLLKVPAHAAEYGAIASGSSAVVSYTATNLPVVQYVAACVAIVSGILAGAWVVFKFYMAFKMRKQSRGVKG